MEPPKTLHSLTASPPPLTEEAKGTSLTQVAALFEAGKAEVLPGTRHLRFYQVDEKKYFGIHKTEQASVDFASIRLHILHKLGLPSNTPVVQIIGDSAKFNAHGSALGMQYIHQKLSELPHALILWGYSASGVAGETLGDTRDTNGIVNDWIDSDPTRASRALGNVVDYGPKTSSEKIADTATVIDTYKAKVPISAKNFYVVYGKAQFGDDIDSSDSITDHAFCLDGGAQAWRQVVNLLSRNIKVEGLFNLRGEKNPATFVKQLNDYGTFFSTGEFIYLMRVAVQAAGNSASEAFVTAFKNEYLKTHRVFNPDRHDAETKQPLFDAAWKKFIDEKLWTKLDNCTFRKFTFDHKL